MRYRAVLLLALGPLLKALSVATAPLTPLLNRFLRMAVLRGVEESVRLHLDRGDDVNARDEQGMTVLMLSAARNNGRICCILLEGGAESNLRDPQGDDALAIAIKAGASEARLAIEAYLAPAISLHEPEVTLSIPAYEFPSDEASEAEQLSVGRPAFSSVLPYPIEETATELSTGGLMIGDWEAEDHELPPAGDSALMAPTFAAQAAITQHIPLDTSVDWIDFEVFLPDSAAPLPRGDHGDIREHLRLLILRALRESSVPGFAVEDLSRESDGLVNEDGESQLRMLLNDLGAELDERLEINFPFESHVVFVAPEETEEEEAQVDSAMAYLDDLASRRNDPIRIYLKTGLREKLLSSDEEMAFGKAMEDFIAKALDILSLWNDGLAYVCESAELIRSDIHPLRWMSSGQVDDMDEAKQRAGAKVPVEPEENLNSEQCEVAAEQSDSAVFFAGIDALKKIMASTGAAQAKLPLRCRELLDQLHLKRDFLIGMTAMVRFEHSKQAAQFDRAMNGYLAAREQMTTANLKLVVSVAKKYLYTEEPFDDLIQEGNIGLMKAVDRFDWRRGFRFSTYATLWIKQNIQRYVADKCSVIRIPVHVHETTQKILLHMRVAEMRNGRAPTPEEVADALSIPLKKVSASLKAAASSRVVSLDEADESLAIEFTEDFAPRDPGDAMVNAQIRASIETLLLELNPKDAEIISMRYGLGINDAMTLDAIGRRFEVTREAIRQMESKAIRFLKRPVRLDKFIEQISGKPDSYYAEEEASRLASQGFNVERSVVPKRLNMKPAASAWISFKVDELVGDKKNPDRPSDISLSTLDEVLEEALSLGISIDEREEDGSRRIWIELLETPDTPTRMLVLRLLQQGFKFWPQKGYWK